MKKALPECRFMRVETREEFLSAVETFQPGLIISDYMLPRFNGMAALKLALERVPETPFLILTDIEFPWPVAEVVLRHHERVDGSGYPAGLKDDTILPEARIIAVADVVEAMASFRPYRPALGIDAALAKISGHRGDRYDLAVTDACLRVFKDGMFKFA